MLDALADPLRATDRAALLDRLLADLKHATVLAPSQAAELLLELTCVQATLAARMAAVPVTWWRHG